MVAGPNIIAQEGKPLSFKVANPQDLGFTAPEPRMGEALRTWVRSMTAFQKEALVASSRSNTVWRMVSDEGNYLNGHDAAPAPLTFLTVGMVASYMNEIVALAAQQKVGLRNLRLVQNNYYSMRGSMKDGSMTAGALPVDLEVEVDCDLDDDALQNLLINAVHASPLNGLMRHQLTSFFTLTRNGDVLETGEVETLNAPVIADPGRPVIKIANPVEPIIQREGQSPKKDVAKGSAGQATSLTNHQDRVLNLAAICTLRDDGIKEIEQHLYSPHGTMFRFLSEESDAAGGRGRAPDAASYISAGIGFCFMTQFGRKAAFEKLNLPHYSIIQDTHFSLGGASGGTGKAGEAAPVETHVHLVTTESDDVSRQMLDTAEQTCFLHAFC